MSLKFVCQSMENDDKYNGYSEGDAEEEPCSEGTFQNHCAVDDSMITDRSSTNGERMAIRLLAECASSTHAAPRQSAAKQLLDVLHLAVSTVEVRKYVEEDVIEEVFLHIQNLAEDKEAIVRCTMLATLPKVARVCAEYDSPILPLKTVIQSEILPILLKAIAYEDKNYDPNIRNEALNVRKEGYNALKQLLSEELINHEMIENEVCSIFQDLVYDELEFSNYISAGNFLARMASVVGEATTEKLLLPKISELCSHPHYKVREGCVYYLTDLAFYVNSMITENIIIPLFIKLSQDEYWCVRTACARTAVILSCLCLMESRKTVLCWAFLDLLYDPIQDFGVTSSAFQQLGAFITTFAQPSLTALGSSQNGETILIYNEGSTFKLCMRPTVTQLCEEDHEKESSVYMYIFPPKSDTSSNTATYSTIDSKNDDTYESDSKSDGWIDCTDFFNDYSSNGVEKLSLATNEKDVKPDENLPSRVNTWENNYENQPDLVQSCLQKPTELNKLSSNDMKTSEDVSEIPDDFNSFQYWRDPIPDFDDRDIPSSARTLRRRARTKISLFRPLFSTTVISDARKKSTNSSWNGIISPERDDNVGQDTQKTIDGKFKWSKNGRALSMCTLKQNVLPQALLEAFISMPLLIPVDIKMDCVYSFPAVLLTVGAENWSLLKTAYSKLAFDSERKLRQMVASSIHEVAGILGPELATQDLIPIYNSLINDIEDIRITALNHLSCFVKLLKPHGRCMFLPHLMEFMMTDYTWNWRFRKQLSEQLIEMIDYFAPSDCWKYVSPVAFTLLMDRVSAVRLQALNLITNLIRVVSADINLLRGILAELAEQFAHSTQWARRQSFAFLCSCLIKTPVLPDDMFARDVLPHLLDLSWDSIPNVRIAVARTLSCDVITYPFFSNVFSPHYDVLTQVLKRLCKDKDRDVRYFASLNSSALPPLPSFEKADI